jgi:hypothetical protein
LMLQVMYNRVLEQINTLKYYLINVQFKNVNNDSI